MKGFIDIDTRSFGNQVEAARRKFAKAIPQVNTAASQAINGTARRVMTQARRELARAKAIPQKTIKKRISFYPSKPNRLVARVWIGVKRSVPLEGAQVRKLRPRVFQATIGGKKRTMQRRLPSVRASKGRAATSPNLPIESPRLRLMPEAQPILERAAAQQCRSFLPNEFRRLLKVRLERIKAK